MMQEEYKDLLLNYLCMVLPYNVKVAIKMSKDKYSRVYDLRKIDNDSTSILRQQVTIWNYGFYSTVASYPLIDCRPYLRPLSSMTEEELIEFNNIPSTKNYQIVDGDLPWDVANYKQIVWLLKNHFDFMDLIPKDLAIAVTENNNPYPYPYKLS